MKTSLKTLAMNGPNFNQDPVPEHEIEDLFKRYFSIFPDEVLSNKSIGFDLGCGKRAVGKNYRPKGRGVALYRSK